RRLAADLGSTPLPETLDGLPTGAPSAMNLGFCVRERSRSRAPLPHLTRRNPIITLEKTPGGLPRRGSSAQVVTRASRNDVAVDTDAKSVVVLVRDAIERRRLGLPRSSRIGHDGSVRCGLHLLIDDVEAHIEPRREVVLGTGTDRPPVPVVLARTRGPRQAGGPERDRASSSDALRTADRCVGGIIVADAEIRAVDRGAEDRQPQVVVGRVDTPHRRQLDVTSCGTDDATVEEAVAEAGAVELRLCQVPRRGIGRIAGRALGVVDLELEVVAALSVELGAEARSPAHLIGRMTAGLR